MSCKDIYFDDVVYIDMAQKHLFLFLFFLFFLCKSQAINVPMQEMAIHLHNNSHAKKSSHCFQRLYFILN